MTLYENIISFGFALPIAGAFMSARAIRPGYGGYALSIAIGLLLGTFCAWTIWKAGDTILRSIAAWKYSDSQKEWIFGLAYFSAFAWAVCGFLLGLSTSSVLLRFAL